MISRQGYVTLVEGEGGEGTEETDRGDLKPEEFASPTSDTLRAAA